MKAHDPRSAVRMPRYLGAKIQCDGRRSVINCIVRNQSRDGALIAIDAPVKLPKQFYLHINKTDRRYGCELVWSGSKQAGVRFRAEPGTRRPPYLQPVA